jgi:hypothetical protein
MRLTAVKLLYSTMPEAEIRALNMYTRHYDAEMNALLRGSFDFVNKTAMEIRDVIIHSVLCSSALTKVSSVAPKVTYRVEGLDNPYDKERLEERIQAVLNKRVIALQGFISTSSSEFFNKKFFAQSSHDDDDTDDEVINEEKTVKVIFHNLKGKNIAAFSEFPLETEFLIPPTQIQVMKYEEVDGKHLFHVHVASDLASELDEKQFASPEQIKALEKKANSLDGSQNLRYKIIKNKLSDYLEEQIKKYSSSINVLRYGDKASSFQKCLNDLKKIDGPELKNIIKNVKQLASQLGDESSFTQLNQELKKYMSTETSFLLVDFDAKWNGIISFLDEAIEKNSSAAEIDMFLRDFLVKSEKENQNANFMQEFEKLLNAKNMSGETFAEKVVKKTLSAENCNVLQVLFVYGANISNCIEVINKEDPQAKNAECFLRRMMAISQIKDMLKSTYSVSLVDNFKKQDLLPEELRTPLASIFKDRNSLHDLISPNSGRLQAFLEKNATPLIALVEASDKNKSAKKIVDKIKELTDASGEEIFYKTLKITPPVVRLWFS